jgi:hypothetical protein
LGAKVSGRSGGFGVRRRVFATNAEILEAGFLAGVSFIAEVSVIVRLVIPPPTKVISERFTWGLLSQLVLFF